MEGIQTAVEEVLRTLREWQEARREADKVAQQFATTRSVDASGKFHFPERHADDAAYKEMWTADVKTQGRPSGGASPLAQPTRMNARPPFVHSPPLHEEEAPRRRQPGASSS